MNCLENSKGQAALSLSALRYIGIETILAVLRLRNKQYAPPIEDIGENTATFIGIEENLPKISISVKSAALLDIRRNKLGNQNIQRIIHADFCTAWTEIRGFLPAAPEIL